MRRCCGSILFVVAALVCCGALAAGDGQNNGIDKILKRFPGYHLLTLQEHDSEVRTFFTRHFPKANPSLVRADFDGNGYMDYALLLKADKSEAAKLVVLLCSADDQCKVVSEQDETAYAGGVYLRPVSRNRRMSETEAVEGNGPTRSVTLRSTGIEVTYFEKAKVVLYWNDKLHKIEEIGTED